MAIRLEEHKERTEHKAIERALLPEMVVISLLQHLGKPLDILKVKTGDRVKRGQLLATAQGGLFALIHASISGVVKGIQDTAHPVAGHAKAVVIESDGQDEAVSEMAAPRSDEEVDALTVDALKEIIFSAGIVGLGGASFPTHIKLSPSRPIKHFILNGAECEPYLTADDRLMQERCDEIIKGVKLIAKIIKPEVCTIAIEDNKPEAIRRMRERAALFNWDLKVLKAAYPQGGEKQIIKSCLNKEVPSGKLPFDIGVVVQNVATVYAIFEAVYLRKPLYERVVTVTGPVLANPKNLLVRIGTPMGQLLQQCGPMVQEAKKLLMGGPMMGVAQYTMDSPVVKGTSGVIAFGDAGRKTQQESFCIRCGECVERCPIGLNPSWLAKAIDKERLDLAEAYGIMDCIECGLCAYLCPGNRSIVEAIKTAKAKIRRQKQNARS